MNEYNIFSDKPDEVSTERWLDFHVNLVESPVPLNSRILPLPIVYNGLIVFALGQEGSVIGHCHLQIYTSNDDRLVIASQLPSNERGLSITNDIEEIAEQVINGYSIDPSKLILIEHYPPFSFTIGYYDSGKDSPTLENPQYEERYSRVTFEWSQERHKRETRWRARNPQWEELTPIELHKMIMRLIKNSKG